MKDIFRRNYKPLEEIQKREVDELKRLAEELYSFLDRYNNREISLSKTALEESIMWATKGLTT